MMQKKISGKLENKVVIITGATSGMGYATASRFAAEGASLMVTGRNPEKGEVLLNHLRTINNSCVFIPADVSEIDANKKLVEETIQTFGKLDMLILNAGILGLGSVTELPPEIWQKTIDTNLSSIYYICKYALPELQKSDAASILINASIAAFKSFPNHPAYCASKAGAVALMKQLSVDYAPRVRVNAICPGPVDTPLLHRSITAFEAPEKILDKTRERTLLKRLGTSDDIAKLALFLTSEDASWITGAAYTIDGGIMNS